MTKQVVGLFQNVRDAEGALRELNQAGFTGDHISVVTQDEQGGHSGGTSDAGKDAGVGATGGGVLGGLGGLLVGLGAFAIPGIGPVLGAGTLAAALGSAAVGAGVGAAAGGLVGALVGAGVPEHDANIYAEGVRRGGTLVTVQADDEMANRAAEIMDRHNVQDIDSLGQNYRGEGWSRFDSSSSDTGTSGHGTHGSSGTAGGPEDSGVGTGVGTLSGAATGAAIGSVGGPIGTVIGGIAGAVTGAGVGKAADRAGANAREGATGDDASYDTTTSDRTGDTAGIGSVTNADYSTSGSTSGTSGTTHGQTTGTTSGQTTDTTHGSTNRQGETAIPIIEEQLNVSKREVETGGVRVNTQVTEKPVNQEVTLRDEHVQVERRQVDRPIDSGELEQLREGTFEVRERAEVPEVRKEARVVEEVVINKEQHEHRQAIQDTVRRTDVNVEQLPGTGQNQLHQGGSITSGQQADYGTSGSSHTDGTSGVTHGIEHGLSKAENALERGTGSDLNKDGDVGRSNV